MTAAVPLVERLAERLKLTHFDGNGCGTHGINACSVCHGPSPMSAREVAETLLPVVEQAVAEARGEALREAAAEGERVERIGLTPADEVAADEREWFDKHPLRNVDGFQRHRPVIANWLRARADAIATTEGHDSVRRAPTACTTGTSAAAATTARAAER